MSEFVILSSRPKIKSRLKIVALSNKKLKPCLKIVA